MIKEQQKNGFDNKLTFVLTTKPLSWWVFLFTTPFHNVYWISLPYSSYLGDNCIQNLILWRCRSCPWYTSPYENFEFGYPHSYTLLQFCPKLARCKPYNASRHPMKCDVISEVKLFLTEYRRLYCHKSLTLFYQKQHYKTKCIRIACIYKLSGKQCGSWSAGF